MNTVIAHVNTSPVNMADRKALGIKAGDTVKVHQKIQDKGKTRIQIFDGVVLARKHGDEPGATFTVRKITSGVGVEKIYPLYSPLIDKIEIVKRAKVRRAKLYYIREKVARQIKRQMRRMSLVQMGTESETEAVARAEAEAAAAEEAKAAAEAAEAEKKAAEAAKAEEKNADSTVSEEAAAETETSAPESQNSEPAAEDNTDAPAAETPADAEDSPVEAEQAEVMEEKFEEAKEAEEKADETPEEDKK